MDAAATGSPTDSRASLCGFDVRRPAFGREEWPPRFPTCAMPRSFARSPVAAVRVAGPPLDPDQSIRATSHAVLRVVLRADLHAELCAGLRSCRRFPLSPERATSNGSEIVGVHCKWVNGQRFHRHR
ncbi:hypothetical protein RHA1_ro08781 (plasmid) [Rhodococcus jostii RHA1]|uniref:Uncharacterized protein n=1 Tax=Rhodococcus jostii (strain RHA1) TaxID=101510 RepID=Q0RY11_RHOJR|nr:hypothetical protein RHA1_ro08781 [Rhodococcus jostii RHA1]